MGVMPLLEFRYEVDGLVMDGSPLTGAYKRGDWWLDGVKLEAGDVVEWTHDGERRKATVWNRDYGYVLLACLVVEETDEGEDDAFDHELTAADAGRLELRLISRWWDDLTAAGIRELIKSVAADLAEAKAQVERFESDPDALFEARDQWADVKTQNNVHHLEYWLRRYQEQLQPLEPTA